MAWTRKTSAGRYQGLYRDGDGRVRTVDGGPWAHKAHAQRVASEAEAGSRSLGWRDPDAARATWGAWCLEWWPTRDVEASTLATDLSRLELHLKPKWANVRLVDITRQDVRAWATELRRGDTGGRPRSAATVQRIVQLFAGSLAAAIDAEVLTSNPAARLKLAGSAADVERFLTQQELFAAVDLLPDEHRATALLLAGTGMRWGEAAGLHHARVDVERRVVRISEVWSERGREVKLYPKSRQQRSVPLPDWVPLADPRSDTCGYPHVGCRSGLVITSPEGRIANDSAFRKAWTAACLDAGVGHVRVHDIRHSYASWLLQDGVSLAEVGKLLGHVSPATTQRYAHLAEVPSESVLRALGSVPAPRESAAKVQQPEGKPRFTLLRGGSQDGTQNAV